jgi:CRISPR-associated protein Cas7/Cse4/CasC subtype I-E
VNGNKTTQKRVSQILDKCGLKSKGEENTDMLVYTTQEAITLMAKALQEGANDDDIAGSFKQLISENVAVPDMALCGRMLETGVIENTTVEAALQAAHAISTHEARPEVDYYVAADDVPGSDAGAGYVDEAMFVSACYYKYFSIDWAQLLENLKTFPGDRKALAAHTVGAFIKAAAKVTPTGKQNSYAAHNPPSGILVEIRPDPISYANAFAEPVKCDNRSLIEQSVAQLAQYILDLDAGYGALDQKQRFWFSCNNRHPLQTSQPSNNEERKTVEVQATCVSNLEDLIQKVIQAIDPQLDWQAVQQVKLNLP